MIRPRSTFKFLSLLLSCLLIGNMLLAHNGKLAYAYPINNIKIDGDLSDWPSDMKRYMLTTTMSDDKPKNAADFSGFFQIGYRMENHSLYLSFEVTDDDFIEDSSKNVTWNTQDGLELYLDARHLSFGSGVASFMYTKSLHHINNSSFDPFASTASWKIMETAMIQKGSKRFYEWKIDLGEQLVVGKSLGLDFNFFDRDADGSFSFTSWGKGESKYINTRALGDILILPADAKLSTFKGHVNWKNADSVKISSSIQFTSSNNPKLWVYADIDLAGNYAVDLPAGNYQISFPSQYVPKKDILYSVEILNPSPSLKKVNEQSSIPEITISVSPVPDLIPAKGVLHNFTSATASQVDRFIETYQKYYNIPGVSLALIKDGKLVYTKTYGVKNTLSGKKVEPTTLFEAASVTKPVFAFAVQRLAERKIIDLDRPLYLYLPYEDIAYDERYKLITARHVLTHRTGFPNWRSMNPDGKLDIKFTPGTSYNYSGEGFEYLKMVIEKITGKKVEQVLQEEVIQPMGLYHTFFSANDSLKQMVASGHYDGIPTPDNLPTSPGMAYSMHTEAKIFTRFMLYLMNQKGLKKETYDTMFQRHSDFTFDPNEPKPKIPGYMGMSLQIRETPFGKSFGHGGNNGDFKCTFEVYKDIKMGYVLFTNSNTSDNLLQAIREFLVEGKETK